HAADRRVDLWPCGTFTARQRIVQPQAVVQPENRRLADRACGSAADRLVRVAFELDRTAVPHLYQQPAAGSATGTRRSVVLWASGNQAFRLDEIRHRLFGRS